MVVIARGWRMCGCHSEGLDVMWLSWQMAGGCFVVIARGRRLSGCHSEGLQVVWFRRVIILAEVKFHIVGICHVCVCLKPMKDSCVTLIGLTKLLD